MGVEKAQGNILTEQQFNASPFKNLMSYQEYFTQALRLGSAFTFARALTLKNAETASQDIRDGVDGWYIQKEQDKADAEEQYYAALGQCQCMRAEQDKALRDLKYATNMFGEETSQYNDALKKYNLSSRTLFNANTSLDIARTHFYDANNSAFKAYLSTQLT